MHIVRVKDKVQQISICLTLNENDFIFIVDFSGVGCITPPCSRKYPTMWSGLRSIWCDKCQRNIFLPQLIGYRVKGVLIKFFFECFDLAVFMYYPL